MKYTELASTRIKIPAIVFGTSALGNLYTALEDDIKLKIVEECFTHLKPPVLFDSAGKYGAGLALEVLGKCLNKLNVPVENVLISNKLGWKRIPLKGDEPTFEKGVWCNLKHDAVQDISYKGIINCWEQGNELLGGKYLPQLLSVHDPDEYILEAKNQEERAQRLQDIVEAYSALLDLKKQGKTKAVGIGAKDWKIIQEICQKVDLDWVMLANSMTIYTHSDELLEFMSDLQQKGVTIINSAVFNAGFLIGGKFFNYKLVDKGMVEYKELFDWRDAFLETCNEFAVSPAHACVQFGMSHPAVASIALNTSKPGNVVRNVEAVQQSVPKEFFVAMKEKGLINKDYPYFN